MYFEVRWNAENGSNNHICEGNTYIQTSLTRISYKFKLEIHFKLHHPLPENATPSNNHSISECCPQRVVTDKANSALTK